MEQSRPVRQSVWARTWEDTRHTAESVWFLATNVVVDFALAVVVALLSADAIASKFGIALLGLLGAVAGGAGLTLMTLLFHFVRAPYRQRDEARTAVNLSQTLDLYCELSGLALFRAIDEESKDRMYYTGSVLILNRGSRKVILRLRVKVPLAPPERPQPWHTSYEYVYANGPCVREDWLKGGSVYVDVGDVAHLPTEVVLNHGDHIHGHTEFVLRQVPYLESNHGQKWQSGPGRIEAEDLISRQVQVLHEDIPDDHVDAQSSEAAVNSG